MNGEGKVHKLKEKKTRTRADSRLLNLSANVRRLRRDDGGETFPATCWYHLAQRLEAQCSGNLTLYLTYVARCIQMGPRARAKCISQRSLGSGCRGEVTRKDEARARDLKIVRGE